MAIVSLPPNKGWEEKIEMTNNNNTAITTRQSNTELSAEIAEKVFVKGDLSQLTPAERLTYYKNLCDNLGLNAASRPFEYITLQGKLTLYARKDATEQLRKRDHVSIVGLDDKVINEVYVVTAHAQTADGRHDFAKGAVNIKGLSGEALANAMMKAETKAKRRVTLSICGLGILDETEADSVQGAQVVTVDDYGQIVGSTPAQQIAPPAQAGGVAPGNPQGAADFREMWDVLIARGKTPAEIMAEIRKSVPNFRKFATCSSEEQDYALNVLEDMLLTMPPPPVVEAPAGAQGDVVEGEIVDSDSDGDDDDETIALFGGTSEDLTARIDAHVRGKNKK